MALNLEKQLRFYGAYHHHPVNVAIHITCVPLIMLSGLMLASNAPNLDVPETYQIPYYPLNVGTILAAIYAVLYILMEPVAGVLVSPFILGGIAYCNHLLATYGSSANKWAIGVNVFSWIAQFIGHGVFEGRAPALMDNLVQAFFLAPFFVWFEILFFFGYRPELKARLDKGVEAEIKAFKESQNAKTTNGSSKKEL